jgi:hypothetical protein
LFYDNAARVTFWLEGELVPETDRHYHDRYEAAARGEKAELAMEIVKKIQRRGSNFLKEDNVGFVVIDDAAARFKLSHTFRNHRIAARTALKKAAVPVPSNSRYKYRFRETGLPEIPTDIEHKKRNTETILVMDMETNSHSTGTMHLTRQLNSHVVFLRRSCMPSYSEFYAGATHQI